MSGSSGQESSLTAQERELRERVADGGREVAAVYRDRASGLNERRRGLTRLRAAAAAGELAEVWVTHEDRLTRFGFSFLCAELRAHGVSVNVLHERQSASAQQELLDDFMSLLASFSGRVYGRRSADASRRLLDQAAAR